MLHLGCLGRSPSRKGGKAKVLFITSNGIGVGHLTRPMAVARRLPSDKQAIFLTLSQGPPFILQEGFFAEYLSEESYLLWCDAGPSGQPKARMSRRGSKRWNARLQARLQEITAEHNPEAVVFDGVWIYEGLYDLVVRDFGRPFIWPRRAMWKPEQDESFLERSWIFDAIIEPGELAESMDFGLTVAQRRAVIRIPPVIFLDEIELLDKNEARAALGLDVKRTAVLIQLGSGNIGDIQIPIGLFVRALTGIPGIQVVVAEPSISTSSLCVPEGIRKVSLYPLSKYYLAFDFAVSASGYNSYHELIAFAVPTIFVPNLRMSDNQASRARYAEEIGVGLCVEKATEESVQRCLNIMLDEEKRRGIAARCREMSRENGAQMAGKLIEDIIQRWTTDLRKTKCRKTSLPQMAPRIIHGVLLKIARAWKDPAKAWAAVFDRLFGSLPFVKTKKKALPRTLFLTLGLSAADLERLLTEVHRAQTMERAFAPVFVTDSDAFHRFRQYGFLFEYIPPEREWNRSGLDGTWSEFSARRIQSAVKAHGSRQVIAVCSIDKADAIGESMRYVSQAYGP